MTDNTTASSLTLPFAQCSAHPVADSSAPLSNFRGASHCAATCAARRGAANRAYHWRTRAGRSGPVAGTGPTVKRTVFSTPRASEFLELRALQAQTGQSAEAFGDVVVKELLDNALDAAETAGRAPVIDIGTLTAITGSRTSW